MCCVFISMRMRLNLTRIAIIYRVRVSSVRGPPKNNNYNQAPVGLDGEVEGWFWRE